MPDAEGAGYCFAWECPKIDYCQETFSEEAGSGLALWYMRLWPFKAGKKVSRE